VRSHHRKRTIHTAHRGAQPSPQASVPSCQSPSERCRRLSLPAHSCRADTAFFCDVRAWQMPLTFGAYSGAAAMICAEIVGRAWLYSYVRLFDCSLNALLFFTALQGEQLFSSMVCR